MKIKKSNFFYIYFILLIILFWISIDTISFGGTPKIVNKLSSAFENIENWFIKLSTPAAAVAVGVGVFMKKFSFGDEERIRSAKKIIRGSLIAYALLLALDLVLSAIKSLIN